MGSKFRQIDPIIPSYGEGGGKGEGGGGGRGRGGGGGKGGRAQVDALPGLGLSPARERSKRLSAHRLDCNNCIRS